MKILDVISISAMLCGFAVTGCSNSNFKSGNKKPTRQDTPTKVDKVLELTCDANGVSKLETQIQGTENTYVTVAGEFCGVRDLQAVDGKMTLMFVVDISGSMQQNDPLESGSCGRLKAIEAILEELKKQDLGNTKVTIGGVTFGDEGDSELALQPMEDFESEVSASVVCSDSGGGTNYEDAFETANSQLSGLEGPKYIYFISDGIPTVSSAGSVPGIGGLEEGIQDAIRLGRSAAAELRQQVTDLTFNAIFLGTDNDSLADVVDLGDFDPEDYLAEITGSPDRVRVVTNADDLASEITTFEPPEPLDLQKDSVKGLVIAGGFGEKAVAIKMFELVDPKAGKWRFETEPIPLFGRTGTETSNKITFQVTASDGQVRKAEVEIEFVTRNRFD